MGIKISIVVPVYNVDKYLVDCLDSLINQTLDSKEIIIVNDASTDDSIKIINKYKAKYKNIITVIDLKENKGLSNARNIGIQVARGEYIGFVDSDDFIDKNMYKHMLDVAYIKKLDMVICDYNTCENSDTYEKYKETTSIKYKYTNFSSAEILKKLLRGEIPAFAWNKIYKSSLLKNNNIMYPVGLYYEDIPTIFKLLLKSVGEISILECKLYYYRNRPTSIARNATEKSLYDYIKAIESVNKDVKSITNINLLKDLEIFNINSTNEIASLYSAIKIREKSNVNYNEINRLCNFKDKKIINILILKNISLIEKVKFILLKIHMYHSALKFRNILRDLKNQIS